ncbi:MAG: MFS transporter [Candidatus Sericytochromatia bacterium]|nr:MFS transporter [Candidatus Sericytochromatia bacterium]
MSARPAPSPLLFLFITLLLDIMGIGLIVPITPGLVAELAPSADPSRHAALVGYLFASFTFMQFLAAPFLGALSDAVGRKPVLLVALVGTSASYVGMALANSLELLFAARVAAGLAGASLSVVSTCIADLSSPEDRAKNFGILGAAFGIGFILGPALGGLLSGHGLRTPFWAAAGLAAVNAVYGTFAVRESLPVALRRAVTPERLNPLGSWPMLWRLDVGRGLVGVLILSSLAQQCLQTNWVVYTTYRFSWSPTENGVALALVGVSAAVVQGGLIRKIMPVLGEQRAVVWGMLWSAVVFIAYGLATQGWMMYAILSVAAVGGLSGPALQALISMQVDPAEQGRLQGALASLVSLTGVVGPLVANGLFSAATSSSSPFVVPGVAFFMGAILFLGAVAVAASIFRRHPLLGAVQARKPLVEPVGG